MISDVTLGAFVLRYLESRDLSAGYALTLRKRCEAFERFAGGGSLHRVFTEELLNRFLMTLSCSPWTINKYRGDLLCVWRCAADEELTGYPNVRRVKRLKQPAIVVQCYTVAEARRLIEFASLMRGALPNGVPNRRYWPPAIRCAWDSGLRRGDLWRVRREAIRPDGSLLMVQSKTNRLVACRLRRSTIDSIEAAGGSLAFPLLSWSFGMHFRAIVHGSGVNRGTFRWFRRASGSYVESLQPGAGHKHLGHATPSVFDRHYDARLGSAKWPLPPEL